MTRHSFSALLLSATMLASPALAGEQPTVYATPQDALDAMRGAIGSATPYEALLGVFGTDADDLLSTGNPERNAENRAEMAALLNEGYRFQPDGDDSVVLLLGADGWPFPIPISKTGDGWAFDLEAGRDEVYFRRIGENELNVIDVMNAYVDIQFEYRLEDHDGDGVMEFASSLLPSGDGRDGLFWAEASGPLGERIARADMNGYNDGQEDRNADPYGGYYYKILSQQGDAAAGGAMDYMINGHMLGGHALLAVPSDYGLTGIHSFMVGENGIVYEADLGDDSLEKGFAMTRYDPDANWSPVD